MNCAQLSEVGTLEGCQTVDSDALVFGHHDDFSIALRELEAANDVPNDNLVLQNDRIRAINHDTRAVLAHDSEQ